MSYADIGDEVIDPESLPHKIERVCRDRKQLKMCRWSSSFTQTGKPEYKTRCDDCQNIYLNRVRRAKRPIVTSQKLKAMTFHHRDPAAKEFAISQMLDRGWAVLSAELDKCDLLCFNWHMEEHCGQDQAARTALGGAVKARMHAAR